MCALIIGFSCGNPTGGSASAASGYYYACQEKSAGDR